MLSYWEKQSFIHYDVIIIGSGLVGMHVGIEIKEKNPTQKVLILDRSIFPYGASSRNAGFACIGSVSEYVADSAHMSDEAIQLLFEKRYKGLQLLRQRLGDDKIDYYQNGSYDLLVESQLHALDFIDHYNTLFKDIVQRTTFSHNRDYIKHSRVNADYFKDCIECHIDGELHTGKTLERLYQLCLEKGISFKTSVHIDRFEYSDHKAQVYLFDAARQDNIALHCRRLIFCTNAFTPLFFEDLDIVPGRGQVLVTQPIPHLELKGIHHYLEGYYYFRRIDDRILLGGGRHLDFEKETSNDMIINNDIVSHLLHELKTNILPQHQNDIQIDMTWAGIMAFGHDKQPIIFHKGSVISGIAKLGGMGVALSSILAQELVQQLTE